MTKPRDDERVAELAYKGARTLIGGRLPLSQQLRDAWNHRLSFIKLLRIPWPDLAENYLEIEARFALDGPWPQIEVLPEHEQQQIAEAIFDFHARVCRRVGGWREG